jgi:predicted nuclease of predicted toxin-antitoxin system
VRLLLDENLPHDLARLLVGHQVDTVADRGWSGIQNGELLAIAGREIDAFLTMDRRLPEQQDLTKSAFGVLLIQAASNRMVHLKPLVPAILIALPTLRPGTVLTVGA